MFDALPLAIAISLFIPFWPERMLPTPGAHSALPLNRHTYLGTGAQSQAELIK
jgi:hypothetical protein